MRLQPAAGGAALAPVFDKDDKEQETSTLTFPTPLAENASYSVVMPAGLKDIAGRVLSNAAELPAQGRDGCGAADRQVCGGTVRHRRGATAKGRTWAMLPVTLRHVQGELRPSSTDGAGHMRVKRLETDADNPGLVRAGPEVPTRRR